MIGENIQHLRKSKSMSQESLAEKVGVSRQTIAKWEAGESAPDLEMAGKLSQALDVSLDMLANEAIPQGAPRPDIQGKHIFGLVTVGDKGQIVIPVQARRVFQIKPGDQLLVLGDEERGLALLDAKFFMQLTEVIKHGSK